eukprot:scaffold20044_cov101-Isochrysis_galbana.AAC.3
MGVRARGGLVVGWGNLRRPRGEEVRCLADAVHLRLGAGTTDESWHDTRARAPSSACGLRHDVDELPLLLAVGAGGHLLLEHFHGMLLGDPREEALVGLVGLRALAALRVVYLPHKLVARQLARALGRVVGNDAAGQLELVLLLRLDGGLRGRGNGLRPRPARRRRVGEDGRTRDGGHGRLGVLDGHRLDADGRDGNGLCWPVHRRSAAEEHGSRHGGRGLRLSGGGLGWTERPAHGLVGQRVRASVEAFHRKELGRPERPHQATELRLDGGGAALGV